MENIDYISNDFDCYFNVIYEWFGELASDADLLSRIFYKFRLEQMKKYNAIDLMQYIPSDVNALKNLLLAFDSNGTRDSLVYACRAFFGEKSQLISVRSDEYGIIDLDINSAGTQYEFIEAGSDTSDSLFKIIDSDGNNIKILAFENINYNPAGILEKFLPTGFKIGVINFTYIDISTVVTFNMGVVTLNNISIALTQQSQAKKINRRKKENG
jgi:hypothetical protein